MESAKTRILIVEHEMRDVDLLEHELKKGRIDFVSQIVQNEREYCDSLKTMKGSRDTLSDASFYYRFVLADASVRYIYSENKFEFDLYGTPIGLYGIIQDITERKGEEQKLKKANRLYAFISQINQSIVHLKSEEALYSNSCRIAIEFGKFKMAWIGMFDPEKKIRLVEQAGMPDDGTQLFFGISCEDNNPQEYVLRTGKYYVCNHIEKLFEQETWKPFAAKRGIFSLMVLPIRGSGRVIGTFNLYANEINFFDTAEIALLEEVTGDISFAIDIFENKLNQIRQVLEAEIKESEALITANFSEGMEVFTVKSYLYSIFYNLISNAIKYRLPNVPLLIHIKSTRDEKFICLSVSDNGRGIDLVKNGSKIFGLYKRFHGDTIPGRGIGLNLVKTHIESMGGRVEVASKVNEGTTFKIYIPMYHAIIAA